MIAQIELNVYRSLVSYFTGAISLTEFRHRFDSLSWDTQEWNSDLLGHIELALAEFSSGHRTEQELKDVLKANSPNLTVWIEPLSNVAVPLIFSGANNQLVKRPVAIAKTPDVSVGKLYEVESA